MTFFNEIPLLPVLLIIFLAAFVRATFGFGDALVAMPLLAQVISFQISSPLVSFLGLVIGISMLIVNWKKIDLQAAWKLVLSSLLGIPIGLYFLKTIPEQYIRIVLGVILILFGAYNLFKPNLPTIKSDLWAYALGFLGGILGGAYNANGPPVIIYGRLAHWKPERFRATLQSYFLPTSVFIFIGHGLAGSWTPEVLTLFGYSLPVIVLALVLGTMLSKCITEGTFDRLVYLAILGMGLLMFIR